MSETDTPIDNKLGLQAGPVEGDDLEALEQNAVDAESFGPGADLPDVSEGLSLVPDVGDSRLVEAEEPEVTPEAVDELFGALEEQNAALVNQLGILGKGVNPLVLLKIQLDTLIDFTIGQEDARKQFETACSMRLNETLKMTLAKLLGAEVQ